MKCLYFIQFWEVDCWEWSTPTQQFKQSVAFFELKIRPYHKGGSPTIIFFKSGVLNCLLVYNFTILVQLFNHQVPHMLLQMGSCSGFLPLEILNTHKLPIAKKNLVHVTPQPHYSDGDFASTLQKGPKKLMAPLVRGK